MSAASCPNGCANRGAEIPEESRHFYAAGVTHYSTVIGVEIRGLYDGVAYWVCPTCGERWHRFPVGDSIRARVEQIWQGMR